MAKSLRDSIDVCSDMGGFSTELNCVGFVKAKIHRAGSASDNEDYVIDLLPTIEVGNVYTFDLPVAFFSFPVGYYDADIYDGDLFKSRIRLNLHTSGMTGRSRAVLTECPSALRVVPPNTSLVVECTYEGCCDTITIGGCEATTTVLAYCDLHVGTHYGPSTSAALASELNRRRELRAFKDAVHGATEVEFMYDEDEAWTIADMLDECYPILILEEDCDLPAEEMHANFSTSMLQPLP